MNTFLSEQQEKIKQQYADFARAEVSQAVSRLQADEGALKSLLSAMGQAGYLGITAAQAYGGKGQPLLHLVLLVEAISIYDPGLSVALAAHACVIDLLSRYASDQQKSRYLPLLARGECLATVALHEPQAGTDLEAVNTTALKSGESISLNGTKSWVANGQNCGLMLVLARQQDDRPAMFIADISSASRAVEFGPRKSAMGLQSASFNDVHFENLEIPAENQLGAGASAIKQAREAIDLCAVVVAAGAVGITEGSLESSANFARVREQFGKPIGQFQAVQWKLADMSVDSYAARLLTYRAAWSRDEDPEQFALHAAMSKLFAARAARFHSGEAMQILGIEGLTEDGSLQRLYREAKALEILEGTPEFHKMTLVKELGI